jgi:putative SOS response-associated peptidase YedK
MCGRFLLTAPVEALRRLFGVEAAFNLAPRYNIAPTQETPVLRLDSGGGRVLAMLRWGLVPSWAKDPAIGSNLINARADTVAAKPSFRAAFRQRRCLVPADGFYEWKAGAPGTPKQPYLIARADGATFAFAGLWELWQHEKEKLYTFTIVTTDANAALAPIHHRMPVILDPGDYAAWLDPANKDAQALLKPAPEDWMRATPISTRVNAVRNDDASLIEPLEAPPADAPAIAKPARGRTKGPPPGQGSLF